MRVLALNQTGSPVSEIIRQGNDEVIDFHDRIDVGFLEEKGIDLVVSYGYRYIIGRPVIEYLSDRIINLHISLLPWNRGADPNLWSFLENTPKGVSIHYIDHGIDTGDIIVQKEIFFADEYETLSSTYRRLQGEIVELFREVWPLIRMSKNIRTKQKTGGTFHRLMDKKKYEYLLIKGWDTPVSLLTGKALENLSNLTIPC